MTRRELAPCTARCLALVLLALPGAVLAHGLMTDPPARNAFCGYLTKPDQVANGTAQFPVCGDAFNAAGVNPQAGYSFMAVLTHTQGYAVVGPRTNVCSFNSETWSGAATPWDQPIAWPTTAASPGPLTITWNISWGPHFSDTQEFRYWITKPDFVFQVGKALSFSDFEAQPFCVLNYDDTNPSGNPSIIPDKAAATLKTKCTVPSRSGHHVIYGEWGRNYFTYERFHGCIDLAFGGGTTTSYTLGVTKAGTGTGTVTSSVGGISCGATCSASIAAGTSVTLTATAATGSTFGGWSGACTGTAGTCTVAMSQARTVTATFNGSTGGTTYALSVTRNGTGGGTVYSTPAGIDCGATCSASFASGTVVTLVGDVASGSTFAGWGGGLCTGTGPCTVTMSQARAVTATFNTTTGTLYALTVNRAGAGSGTVTSTPAGISCGSTCAASFNSGTTVTLTAAAASGSTFAGWSGACTGTGSCTTTLTAAQTVTATFNGAGGGAPCANPVTFTNQSGNFNTAGAICLRTSATVSGWGCSNFQGRTVSVSGGAATSTCGAGPFPLPKASDGYTYFSVSAGTYTWASLYTW
jgi:predicted carbohydrate-binding protein with CBM5 and CBM33 domain